MQVRPVSKRRAMLRVIQGLSDLVSPCLDAVRAPNAEEEGLSLFSGSGVHLEPGLSEMVLLESRSRVPGCHRDGERPGRIFHGDALSAAGRKAETSSAGER